MPRPRTPIGSAGSITTTGQITDKNGRLVAAPEGTRPTSWRARARFRDSDGVTRLVERRGPTKSKAEASLREVLADRQLPMQAEGGMRPDMTMIQAGKVWIEQNQYASISDKTRKQYSEEFQRYIVGSSIQGLSLREANNVGTLERFLQQVSDLNGNAAAKAARRVLSNLFNLAVRHRALPHSACRDLRQPRARSGSVSEVRATKTLHDTDRAFTRDERAAVLASADAYPDDDAIDIADLIAFLAGTGVRLSEALACTWWKDVDLTAVDSDGNPNPTVHVRGTKTDKADRVIPLPQWLAERLTKRAKNRWKDGLVFASPRLRDKTNSRDRRNMIRHIRSRLDTAGMPWATSHTFRRTVASWMDEAGAPLAEIANQLGHANVNVTATYLGRRQGSNRAASIL